MSTYSSQLRSPKWQKRRLEVMEKHGFSCQRCGEKTEELNVHHVKYRKGADVWDYSDDQLACLCSVCHQETHVLMDKIQDVLCSIDAGTFFDLSALFYNPLSFNGSLVGYMALLVRYYSPESIRLMYLLQRQLLDAGVSIGNGSFGKRGLT